jgi:hypothetical protein
VGRPQGRIDVLPAVAGLGWVELKPHITQVDVDGVPIPVLDLPDLLKTKQELHPKDQLDAAVLRAAIERLAKGR